MARIELVEVAHSYEPSPRDEREFALKSTNLVWEDGSANALLGPSGCGKTTLLSIVSGLVRPTRGRVLVDGADVTRRPTRARNIAQVFQFPVVYDTMSVYDNLAFPLRNRGLADATIRKRVDDVAAILGLEADLPRAAAGLGADAKQKVSLGRGLVREDVGAILLDEPLTVVDPQMKWLLRRKLRQAHERSGLTMIYVTHDQHEALTFASRVAVMRDGRVVQEGTPEELHERPTDAFVGYFIGSPGMNLVPAQLRDGGALVGAQLVPLAPGVAEAARRTGRPLTLGIRPEFLALAPPGTPGAVRASVRTVEDLGSRKIIHVSAADLVLKVKVDGETRVAAQGDVWLTFPPDRVMIYADGKAVAP
jgi:glycerol transport system ATP-binding protein